VDATLEKSLLFWTVLIVAAVPVFEIAT